MSDRHRYIGQLFAALQQHCLQQAPFNAEPPAEYEQEFLQQLAQLAGSQAISEDDYDLGRKLAQQVISQYPHITPTMSRDLLWLLGGDCLHFLADDELAHYQRVEELLYENEGLGFVQGAELAREQAGKSVH